MITSSRTSLLKEVDFEEEVPCLISATLAAFDRNYRAIASRKEDPISRQLVFALLRLQTTEGWEWLSDYAINSQRDELDADLETHEGRTDIAFELGGHHRFIWECKRLHENGKTLYSEYRSEGAMRFVSGRYAGNERLAGMLAFVMDGKISKAIDGIGKHLVVHSDELKMQSGRLLPCVNPDDSRLRVSLHFSDGGLTLFHCFLSLVPA